MVATIMEPEFAPQYSPKERVRHLLLHGVVGALMVGALYWWAFPRYRAYLADAPCETVFGMPGSTLLVYGGFVGVPLAAALLIVLLTARSSMEAIATRRYPPPNRKVFGRVKVKKGWQAIAFALMPAMAVTYLCVLSSQGLATAARMALETQQSADCSAGSKKRSPAARSERPRDPATEHRRPAR